MRKLVRAVTTQKQRIYLYNLLHRVKSSRLSMLAGATRKSPDDFEKPYRLHLGCGNVGLPGYVNVDVMHTLGVDVVDDIRFLKRFPSNSASQIYACHVMEHFGHEEIMPILRRWFDVLMPGGEIRISVPDIDRIVKIYSENPQHFQTPGNSPWIGLIYGGQSTPYDYHKTGYNFCWLRHLMEQVGYVDCSEYPHEPHFIPGVVDASLANQPFGEYISLNMKARKPG
ncbi:class I SAM-dependent methyltransferase [Allorhizobium sp. NPDC080224]|uniref:class I SAM-dependent methyltransferase n=1 Tax=Allorhizobium sp. NPDC080224 TaxID=3390547 RepID=UPI003D07E8A0